MKSSQFIRLFYSLYNIFWIFVGEVECFGHSFAYVAHFMRDVWIRTKSAAVAGGRATYLATP
jgi:hypothetical protein